MLKLSLTIFIGGLIIGFIVKNLMKRRMRRALGRTVKDHELVSLNSWMQVRENEERGKIPPS
ncbi:MAG: hypothetical protein LH614_22670 [Pyrinomonadaceae bacterium]|nr:hypothetical protein [Pyrinomonadaceae bacterium]